MLQLSAGSQHKLGSDATSFLSAVARDAKQQRAIVLASTPLWLFQRAFALALLVACGDVRRFGLPRPDHRILEEHPEPHNKKTLKQMPEGFWVDKTDQRGLVEETD